MSNRREDVMQENCVKWYKYQYPGNLITAFPAGFVFAGSQTKRAIIGKRMKDMGYTNGTPDIFIPKSNNAFHGLFIELKVKPNTPTDSQIAMMNHLQANGYKCSVCYTFSEFVEVVNQYFKDV